MSKNVLVSQIPMLLMARHLSGAMNENQTETICNILRAFLLLMVIHYVLYKCVCFWEMAFDLSFDGESAFFMSLITQIF